MTQPRWIAALLAAFLAAGGAGASAQSSAELYAAARILNPRRPRNFLSPACKQQGKYRCTVVECTPGMRQ